MEIILSHMTVCKSKIFLIASMKDDTGIKTTFITTTALKKKKKSAYNMTQCAVLFIWKEKFLLKVISFGNNGYAVSPTWNFVERFASVESILIVFDQSLI